MYKKAFTLIELLVVIVIIGLLTTVATSTYVSAQQRQRDGVRKTQVQQISAAVESYYAVKNKFPGLAKIPNAQASSIPDSHLGCISINGGANGVRDVGYYYLPSAGDCSAKAAISDIYTPTDYRPAPLWIPGLGSFINPVPIEPRYQGRGGNPICSDSTRIHCSQGANSDLFNDPTEAGRSLFYRQMQGGYIVYTRLEQENGNADEIIGQHDLAMPNGTTIWGVGGAADIHAEHGYMIKK